MSTDFSTPPEQERRGYPPVSALRRSRSDRKFAGVAGGLGQWAGVDPLVFRVLFVVLTFFGGSGILLYAIGWLLVPDEGENESEGQRLLNGHTSSSTVTTVVAGVVALVLGLVLMGSLLDTGPGLGGLGALVAVIAIVVLVSRNHRGPRPAAPPFPDPQVRTPAEPGAYGQTPGTAYTAPAAHPAPAAYAPPASSYAPTAPLPPPPGPRYPTYAPPLPPPPPKERSILGRVTLSVAAIVVGLLIGWNAATDSDVPAQAVIASALAVVGIGLVVGAVIGRARWLVVWGIVLVVLASAAAFADVQLRGGVGDRSWTPHTVADLHTPYRLGVGEATLDLSELDLGTGDRQRVEIRQGVGDLLIVVPADVTVLVDADVRAGEIQRDVDDAFGSQRMSDGTDVSERFTVPEGSAPSSATLVIDAELGLGSLEVRRATS
jgi:phage shock protein PspC (stress-responsive transcriptional regulator)